MKKPLVSVVIPTHNCDAYITDALDSVLSQTYGHTQVIIVDDGSTDSTEEVLEPYAQKIVLIKQDNQGVSQARNAGISASQGDYVAFLDADDRWDRRKLSIQIPLLEEQTSAEMAFSNFDLGRADGEVTGRGQLEHHYKVFGRHGVSINDIRASSRSASEDVGSSSTEDDEESAGSSYTIDAFPWLFLGNFVNTSSVVMRRSLLVTLGGFNASRITQEDYELWLRVALRTRFAYSDESLVFTRRRPGQLTSAGHNLAIVSNVVDVLEQFRDEAECRLGRRKVGVRMAEVRRQLALGQLGARKAVAARRTVRRLLRENPLDAAGVLLWVWSFLPFSLANTIRKLVRRASRLGKSG